MLQNKIFCKKSLLAVLLCIFAAGFIFAQSSTSTSDLTKRFLQKADDQYTNMQYEEAFKTVNAALKLSEKDEIPGQSYSCAMCGVARLYQYSGCEIRVITND